MASMASTATASTPYFLDIIKTELESHDDSVFEHLSAHLMSRLLGDVAVTVSKSGYQVGADASTAGLRGRRLRIECKRYRETTSLRSRDLAGEVAEAADDDELLEAWVLMATKSVKENERKLAFNHGQNNGIAVLVIDWTPPAAGAGICALAALCATWPDVVDHHLGKNAADAARALIPFVGTAVDNLYKDLAVWNIGYKDLREASHKRLKSIWESRQQSRAYFGQDAAGGESGVRLVSRAGSLPSLTSWWNTPANVGSPAAVTGLEGVGKTWVALDWVSRSADDLPIVLVVPASAFAKKYDVTVGGVQDLIASTLKENANSTLTDRYWSTRVKRLLQRPITEGPAFLLLLDGLNQHPNVEWTRLTQALQAETLFGRVRLLFTARQSYFEQDLRRLSQVNFRPVQVPVQIYDEAEFDEILTLHGMNKDQLHESLRPLARTPRLFPLVYRLKDKEALKSDATVHRLLFEYGQDVLEQRECSAFTPDEWAEWLADRAKAYRERIRVTGKLVQPEPVKELATSLASPTLNAEDVHRRLSELVDGHLFEKKRVGVTTHVMLRNEAAVLGLALALLETMDNRGPDFDAQQSALEEWIEPIGAIDQTTDVLRAALALISAGAGTDGEIKTDCLLVTWMNAQNPGRTYEQDAAIFGEAMPKSMLAVIERSSSQVSSAARYLAIQQIRKLPRTRVDDWRFVEERLVRWAGWFYVPKPENVADTTHYAKRHHDQIVERIGTTSPQEKVVLGVRLYLAYHHLGDPASAIPGILESHDLTEFTEIFKASAVREAAQVGGLSRSWPGFQWLVLVGSADEQKTRDFLQKLADDVLASAPEPGIHPRLGNRASALLLRLAGEESMDKKASSVDESFGGGWNYEEDYEKDPPNSYFEPERRHLDLILASDDLPVWRMLEKVSHFLPDPAVKPPAKVLESLSASLDAQTFEGVHSGASHTLEDHNWDRLQPHAARFVPREFFVAAHRELLTLTTRRGEQKYWSALHLAELLLTVEPQDVAALSALRTGTKLDSHEEFANSLCMQLELLHMPIEQQLDHMIGANDYFASIELLEVLRTASADQLNEFLEKHQTSAQAVRVALEVMALQGTSNAEALSAKLMPALESQDEGIRNIALRALTLCAPEVCGQYLLSKNWRADATDAFGSHYGSTAVANASKSFDIEDVFPLIAPWRWLDAVIARGSHRSELEFASICLVRLVLSASRDITELPAELAIRVPENGGVPRLRITEPKKTRTTEEHLFEAMSETSEEANRRFEELSVAVSASIRSIRASGHSIYLQPFEVSAVRAAYNSAQAEWYKLLEGAAEQTADFVRRVRSAEGLYMAFCEVLLDLSPGHGAMLWKALNGIVRTKFNSSAGISDFVHMVFRVPDSLEVATLREALTSFESTSTDSAIVDLVIAAQLHGHDDWLDRLIQHDKASGHQWRHMRGLTLDALCSDCDVQALDWPSGLTTTSIASLSARMAKRRNRGAMARFWWNEFIHAPDASSAFAAWHVFLACADRRAYVWMRKDADKAFKGSELDRLRALHVQANWNKVERELAAREEKDYNVNKHLFGREAPAHWLEMDKIIG
jgi:hypothetical protein